ncbi:MAG: hypothetical protein RJA70_4815 [Pseudomonadota bacterium]|jgi:RNA polymerase sigma-70 factor (ECF subfamily)
MGTLTARQTAVPQLGGQLGGVGAQEETAGNATTDAELVRRMATGDQLALAVLYERHASAVMKSVIAILGPTAQAQDVLQDLFMEAWRAAGQYDSKRGAVVAWLKVRARSRALDKLRAARRHVQLELKDDESAPAPSSERRAASMNLFEALEGVSEQEREVLILGYCEGLTCGEMAEELGIPVGTVKSRTRTAIAKLRAFWEGQPQ